MYRKMTSNNNDNNFCPALPPVGITEPYKIENIYFFQKENFKAVFFSVFPLFCFVCLLVLSRLDFL